MPNEIDETFALSVSDLYRSSQFSLPFEHTDELQEAQLFLGQERAVEAIRFALEMNAEGYNIFVLGPAGSHRHHLALQLTQARAADELAPNDWCYVNNFLNPKEPRALRFPAGQGALFRDAMREVIEELKIAIPAAFEGEDYRSHIKAIEADTQERVEESWGSLRQTAEKQGIGILQTPTGYVLAPVREGKVLSEEEFERLAEKEQEEARAAIQRIGELLQAHIESLPLIRKEHRERVRALDREVMTQVVDTSLRALLNRYKEMPEVLAYLEHLQQDMIENAQGFSDTERSPMPFLSGEHSRTLGQYDVNLLVHNSPNEPAPVIYEPNPSYQNIVGKIEHRAEMGALITDFRLVQAGALHRANGGYLVLDIERVLTRPFVWEGLKRALFEKRVQIESPADTYGWVSTTTLVPEPIPLDIKVVLVGDRWLYYALSAHDSEFNELFQVSADLEDDIKRTPENADAFAGLIASSVRGAALRPFSRGAVQLIVDQRARRAQDGERLSMDMRSLNDLLREADFWAGKRGAQQAEAVDVRRAIEQKQARLNRIEMRILDDIERNLLLIDTSGTRVGQINGLSVVDLGGYRFGHPVRITATTRMGGGEVIDIEREVELGGAIHSKGVLILASALSGRYATDMPLSLRASIVFEQSYAGVDGDSASVAELCALISSLANVGIRQNLAVTGSVNQFGQIQVIGAVNEKIEAYFKVCKARGLDGSHGVVIPRENIKHLMLAPDVVAAVQEKRFSIYSVSHIDEAVSILTGTLAGQRAEGGDFPEGTVNWKVERRLRELAESRQQYAAQGAGYGTE